MRIPLNPIDETFVHLEDPLRPLTIHLEARVTGRLDERRMRTAIASALGKHPIARARLALWRARDRSYEWLVDDKPQLDPLRVIRVESPGGLDALRSDTYSQPISLFESPPFRMTLAHRDGGDHVLVALNHAVCDGIGALRLLQSVLRAYGRVDDPTSDLDPAEAFRRAPRPRDSACGIGSAPARPVLDSWRRCANGWRPSR